MLRLGILPLSSLILVTCWAETQDQKPTDVTFKTYSLKQFNNMLNLFSTRQNDPETYASDLELLGRVNIRGRGRMMIIKGVGMSSIPNEAYIVARFLLVFSGMNASRADASIVFAWRDVPSENDPPPIKVKFSSTKLRREAHGYARKMFNFWRQHMVVPTVTPHPELPEDYDYDASVPSDLTDEYNLLNVDNPSVSLPAPDSQISPAQCVNHLEPVIALGIRSTLNQILGNFCPNRQDISIAITVRHRGEVVHNITVP